LKVSFIRLFNFSIQSMQDQIIIIHNTRGRSGLRWLLLSLRFNLADRLTLGWLAFTSALILLRWQFVTQPVRLLMLHATIATAILILATCRKNSPALPGRPALIDALRHFYPLLLGGFFFEEIGHLVHAIFPQWFDAWLIAADLKFFGTYPTVWIEQFSSYWLTEFLQLAYTLYLPLIPGFGIYLWWRNQREEFTEYTLAICITYYLNYLIFIFFPIEGPYHTLAHLQQVELHGGFFMALIEWIEKHGRVHGGAFPSNHVAGTMVALISALRFSRKISFVLIPLAISICIATVYGRYHYAVDVIAGMMVAGFGGFLAFRFQRTSLHSHR
jgi:membrane-associated phospholipid phosphatase